MLQKAWFALALCCFTGSLGFSQNPAPRRGQNLSITGKVMFTESHEAEAHLEVRLERSTAQLVMTAYTDAAGNFEFRNLGAGSYVVVVNAEGYEPVHQNVDVFNSFSDSSVTIFLSKPAVKVKERPTGLDADDPDVIDVSQMKESLPKKAVQDYERAIEEKKRGRTANAIKLLEEAIHLAPNFFRAHNNLGILYRSTRRYADAEAEFKRSHDLNPKSDAPLSNLGSLYIEEAGLKEDQEAAGVVLDQALDSLEQAVKLNPRSASAYFLLGQANYRSSFFQEAEAAFKKGMEIDPNLSAALLMLANVYVKQERWPEVLDLLDTYLRDNPKAADRASVEAWRDSVAKRLQVPK
jgi:tetratricopeptide (TPR) repeat protein